MAIALDGFDALRRIGGERQLFAAARIEADKAARGIIAKCLKSKTLDLDGLRRLNVALGDETFALIAHEMKDSEALGLLKRFDRHNADLKSATPSARVQRLIALAAGDAQPLPAPDKAKKSVAKSRPPKRIESALMKAFAKAGRGDD